MRAPLFIVFEGIDGAGTSTQCDLLCQRLRHQGHSYVQTREPGGTDVGERIRQVLLDPSLTRFDDLTELMLYVAARRQLVAEKIGPALDAGMPVISDRYAESSVAYQGVGRGLGVDVVHQLNALAVQGRVADLTLILDLPLEVALDRRAGRSTEDRVEAAGTPLQVAVRNAYLDLAAAAPERTAVQNAKDVHDCQRISLVVAIPASTTRPRGQLSSRSFDAYRRVLRDACCQRGSRRSLRLGESQLGSLRLGL